MGVLLPMRAAAATNLASLPPDVKAGVGPQLPAVHDEGGLARAASAGYISFAPAGLMLPH